MICRHALTLPDVSVYVSGEKSRMKKKGTSTVWFASGPVGGVDASVRDRT